MSNLLELVASVVVGSRAPTSRWLGNVGGGQKFQTAGASESGWEKVGKMRRVPAKFRTVHSDPSGTW